MTTDQKINEVIRLNTERKRLREFIRLLEKEIEAVKKKAEDISPMEAMLRGRKRKLSTIEHELETLLPSDK